MSGELIDVHTHLHFKAFEKELAGLRETCAEAGIRACIVNGTRESDWNTVLDLCQEFPDFLYPALGVHPWYVNEFSLSALLTLEALLERYPQASIGECGLDRYARKGSARKGSSWEKQKEVFRKHLLLAHRYQRPLSIHCVKGWGVLLQLLRRGPELSEGMLLHAFQGPVELIAPLVDLGAYFSLKSSFLQEKKEFALELFGQIPKERIVLETDAPEGGHPIQIAQMIEVPEVMSMGLKQNRIQSFQDLAAVTTQNACRLFRKSFACL